MQIESIRTVVYREKVRSLERLRSGWIIRYDILRIL